MHQEEEAGSGNKELLWVMFPESLVKGYEEKYESSLPVGYYAGLLARRLARKCTIWIANVMVTPALCGRFFIPERAVPSAYEVA